MESNTRAVSGGFQKLGAAFLGIAVMRSIVYRRLYWGSLLMETPILGYSSWGYNPWT